MIDERIDDLGRCDDITSDIPKVQTETLEFYENNAMDRVYFGP